MSRDVIMEMVKRHYEAGHPADATPAGGFTRWARWDELPKETIEDRYDAMWHALHVLKEPSPQMVYEGQCAGMSAAQRIDTIRADVAWRAMINHLLEVK